MARCTFKKFTLTVDRYSSAIGFFMKNPWQVSPQSNVSPILMEKSVGLKGFFGRLEQWFGNNDQMSIFHDLDGSVMVSRHLHRQSRQVPAVSPCCPPCNGAKCPRKSTQLYMQARCPENLPLSFARAAFLSHPMEPSSSCTSLASCSSRIISSRGMAEHLGMSSCTPQLQQVAITSTPSAGYIRIQIQSLGRADRQNHSTSAFIKVNGTVFTRAGVFCVVLDACSGAVVVRQHFGTVTSENAACAITECVQTSIKEREFCHAWL